MWLIDPKFTTRIAWGIVALITSVILWSIFLFIVIPAWKETFI